MQILLYAPDTYLLVSKFLARPMGIQRDYDLEWQSANCDLQTKFGSLPVFVNKDLLRHSHAHLFLCVIYGCFCTHCHIWVVVTEPVWPAKPKTLGCDPALYGKRMLTCDLENVRSRQ